MKAPCIAGSLQPANQTISGLSWQSWENPSSEYIEGQLTYSLPAPVDQLKVGNLL